MKPREFKPLGLAGSIAFFGAPAVGFFALTNGLVPFLSRNSVHPALAWFIAGYLTFLPLFAAALVFTFREGNRSAAEILGRLRLRALKPRDWLWTLGGTVAVLLGTGLVFGVSALLSRFLGLQPLSTTPHFMDFEPLRGSERFLLLAWAPMFFFNIFGEELFWRGHLLPRQELVFPRHAWLVNAVCWALFHVAFGWQLMLVLLPILFIQPFVAQRTGSTWPGIIIHGLLNGPMFVLVSLGLLN